MQFSRWEENFRQFAMSGMNSNEFWKQKENVNKLKAIWTSDDEKSNSEDVFLEGGDIRGGRAPCRQESRSCCLVQGQDVMRYPNPKNFDLNQLLSEYGAKPRTLSSSSSNGSLTSVSRFSPQNKGCSNQEDALEFARRYGVDTDVKPILHYRIRKGKYRKEF